MRLTRGRWLGLGLALLMLHAACAPPGRGSPELEVVRPRGTGGARAAPLRVGALETSGAAWLAADGQRFALAAYWRRPEAPVRGETSCGWLRRSLFLRA